MVEMVLEQRSPWNGLAKAGRFGSAGEQPGVRVSAPPPLAMALLVAHKGRLSELLGAAKARGIELPTTPRQVSGPDVTALWNGPGQWLVRGSGSFADLAARLAVLAPFASWIDQSHSRAVLRVAGAHARDALAKGFEIDLHPRAFRAGDVAMTQAAGMSAYLWQVDEAPTYEIAVPASFSGSFWHWVSGAAAEYGYVVEDPTGSSASAG